MLRRFKERGISETEEAQVAIQIGSTGSQTITDRVNGFTEYWEANAPKPGPSSAMTSRSTTATSARPSASARTT